MKSKTSFFNFTAVKKNITRFAPVWGLYTVFLLICLFTMGRDGHPAILARDIWEAMGGMAIINLMYGGICAIMLMGDLFNAKICNAIHAFPVRREGWLLGHIISGILFSFVPNVLITVLASIMLWEYAYMAPIWLAVATLQFLFFFGVGILSAVCAGNRLAMIAVYGIIHFITLLVLAIAELFYQPLLYGIEIDYQVFYRFLPVYQLVETDYVNFAYFPSTIKGYYSGFYPESWRYLCLCGVFGLLAMGLSFLIYRKRALETAGDFISLRPIAPVFLVIYTLGVGAVFYLFSDVFGSDVFGTRSYLYLAIGLVIGFFTGLMLLKRTVKVFTKKAFAGFAVLVAVLAGSMVLTWLDPVGITTHVPEAEEITWAAIYTRDDEYRYREESTETKHTITDPAALSEFQKLHAALAEDRTNKENGEYCNIQVQYALKDGSRVIRHYSVEADSELGQQVKLYLSDMRYLFKVNNLDVIYDQFTHCNIDCYDYTYVEMGGNTQSFALVEEEEILGLMDAIRADCEAGVMAQPYVYHADKAALYSIDFVFGGNYQKVDRFYGVSVFEDCVNTAAYMKKLIEARKNG